MAVEETTAAQNIQRSVRAKLAYSDFSKAWGVSIPQCSKNNYVRLIEQEFTAFEQKH